MKQTAVARPMGSRTAWMLAVLIFAAPQAASAQEVHAGAVVEALAPHAFRWFADEASRAAAPVSATLIAQSIAPGSGDPRVPRVQPEFRTALGGRHAVFVDIEEGTSLYGTGEAAGPLLRNGRRNVAWNFDAYGWGWGSEMLYKSIPWVLAVRADGSAFGILADTPHRVLVDTTFDILMVGDGPSFGVVVIEGETPQAVVEGLARLTGTTPLPPLWALGYHQCRYSYTPDDRVLEVARGFRERAIPADVIWLDIDYMDRNRPFTWDPRDFDDPRGLMQDLDAIGFRSIVILDPGIAADPADAVYASGTARDVWVRDAQGDPFVGVVWPGDCVFPDYTRADVRDWWGQWVGDFVQVGIDGVWNDMNEPAVFRVDSKTMPLDVVHRADDALGGAGTHTRYHNLYGREMSRATYEGLRRTRPERRPFVLTRASHTGGQRWAATWSGDNTASWAHLDMSISVVLNMGLSAWPLSGPDIGGFKGSGGGELFARWMGVGSLLPFARGHTEKGSASKEPWSFGPEVEATCRRALERRYRLMPYLYHLAWESSRSGLPLVRPAFFADPVDASLRDFDDGFLLGDDLLVIARTSPAARFVVPSAFAAWPVIDLDVDDALDPDLPQLRLRPGAVLPLAPVVAHTTDARWEELELVVAVEDERPATATLYEDAGEGFDHLPGHGDERRLSRVRVEVVRGEARVQWERLEGAWPGRDDRPRVRLVRSE